MTRNELWNKAMHRMTHKQFTEAVDQLISQGKVRVYTENGVLYLELIE